MKSESPPHRAIRNDLLDSLRVQGLKPMSSHEDSPEIHFYSVSETGEKIHLADPDILVLRGDRLLAIEIELSLAPKHLLGVAFAISQCTHYKVGNGDLLPLGKFDFLLVVPSAALIKKRSHRPKQLRFIQEALQDLKWFGSARVLGDVAARDALAGRGPG